MMQRLINRLHRAFDKEPRPLAVLYIDTPCTITTAAGKAVVAASSTTAIDIDGITLQAFATQLAGIGITASVPSQYQLLSARGILDTTRQDMGQDNKLYYSTNIFYQEIQVYGWMMQEQSSRLLTGERQAYLHTASSGWLDYWCRTYLGTARELGEDDDNYRNRTIANLIRVNQNNKALEILFDEAIKAYGGYASTVTDMPPENIGGIDYYGKYQDDIYITPLTEGVVDWYTPATVITKLNESVKSAGTKLERVKMHVCTNSKIPRIAIGHVTTIKTAVYPQV